MTVTVTYQCDSDGDHTVEINSFEETRELEFDCAIDALHFIAECTSYQSDIKQIAPHLFSHQAYE